MMTSLPDILAGLLRPEAYPHPVAGVDLITTHISWVLLAGEYAYKVKRPVNYAFIDLTSLERRRFLCDEELRLNRRFAPELYLDVCRIVVRNGAARMDLPRAADAQDVIDNEGSPIEYAVRMRRFSRTEELDQLLDGHRIEPHALEAFGRELAQTHARLPAAPAASAWGRPEQVQAQLLRNLLECADAAAVFDSSRAVLALRQPLEESLAGSSAWMAARRSNGRIRECHGDLHSRNVVRVRGRLVAFDCLEYAPAFRWIDTADEIAFLTSDLKARGWPLHAHAFRGGYLAESGDFHACRALALYEAHRALVRAKVAALSAAGAEAVGTQDALRREHVRLVTFAAGALTAGKPRLLLMSGLSGSGKTWLARQLAERLSAVHIRSDLERKRRAGMRELARSHSRPGQGLYSADATSAVYEELAREAQDVLCGGIPAIVDATFLERAQRALFAELAAKCHAPLQLIHCEAPEPVLRARITERRSAGRDPSEADLDVLAWQSEHAEPPTESEGIDVIRVDTVRPDALDQALRKIGGILAGPAGQL
ncbi:MAG: AAA family ATPase [Gammaproteobacteria bacterium]|nr:AAA family ATPase [Gammaproteobacteria bacterium]